MEKRYEVLEHTADVGLRAYGKTEEETYANAALGLMSLLCNLEGIQPLEEFEVRAEGPDAVELMVRWLHELLFLFDVEKRVFSEVRVVEHDETSLRAILKGERFDPKRHEPGEEIKAVTYHGAKFERTGEGWVAEVLFDI